MPVRGGGQGSQGLRSGHAGGLGNVFGFFLGGGDQYGTLGVTEWYQDRCSGTDLWIGDPDWSWVWGFGVPGGFGVEI